MRTKSLATLFALALALNTHSALAQTVLPTNGVFWSSQAANTTAGPFELNGFKVISFQLTCPTACVATVQVQLQNTLSDTPGTVLTLSNMGAAQLGYFMPGAGYISFVLSWTSGPVNGTLIRMK